MINILIELDIGVSDFIDQINIAHVTKQPPKTNSLLVAHWNCAPRWCIANWEAKFDYTDRWWSGYLNSINNLPSFWILEWSCGKRVHDSCRMDWYLRSKTKKNVFFSQKMIGLDTDFFEGFENTERRQWWWNVFCRLSMGDPPHLMDGLLWHNFCCFTWPGPITWISRKWPIWYTGFLHDRSWISPWIKSISNELDNICHVFAS